MYNKFRPVKRVSPLKHQPESSENNESDDQKNHKMEYQKGSDSQPEAQNGEQHPGDGERFNPKCVETGVLLGELEHYDLDMDEILDVPYIKSSQQLAVFTKAVPEKRILSGYSTLNGLGGKTCPVASIDKAPAGMTPFCVLSPVKSSQQRKAQPVVPDQHEHVAEELELPQPLIKCGSAPESEAQSKGFLNRTFADKMEKTMPNGKVRTFHLPAAATERKKDELNIHTNWNSLGGPEERNEDLKKIKSILSIVKEGQISLLVSLILIRNAHRQEKLFYEFSLEVSFTWK